MDDLQVQNANMVTAERVQHRGHDCLGRSLPYRMTFSCRDQTAGAKMHLAVCRPSGLYRVDPVLQFSLTEELATLPPHNVKMSSSKRNLDPSCIAKLPRYCVWNHGELRGRLDPARSLSLHPNRVRLALIVNPLRTEYKCEN